MAPSRYPSKAAPRANAAPYETRARRIQDAGSSNDVSNEFIIKSQDAETAGDSSPTHATTRRSRTKGAKEFCTEEQSAALEAFFWCHKGYPDGPQILEISAQIGKSAPSVRVWLQNHRHPRHTENTPWFRIPGAMDPEIDPSAPYYPKNPTKRPFEKNSNVLIDALDVHAHQPAAQAASTKLPKAGSKGVIKGKTPGDTSSLRRETPFKPVGATNDTSATSSFAGSPSPGSQINPFITRNSTTPESSCSSGDSNGSEASSPRGSPPAPATIKQRPTPTELFIAEIMLDLSDLRIHPRPSVSASAIDPPFIKQFDQGYASQRPSSSPIRTQLSSATQPRKEDHMLAWRVANPYGRLPPVTKKGSRGSKFVRFADIDDKKSESGSPSMHVSHKLPASYTQQPINNVPGMASCRTTTAFLPPSQVMNAPKIIQIPLPCNCLPAEPLSLITTSKGAQMPRIDRSSHNLCALDVAPAPCHERVNATPSYGDLALTPYVPFPAAWCQDSGNRWSLAAEKGDTTDEEDMEVIAPLCSIAGGIHGECRLSRNVASPARR